MKTIWKNFQTKFKEMILSLNISKKTWLFLNITTKKKNKKSKMNEMKNTTQNVKIQFNSEKKILDKH